ncbi:MAG: penicillin-binding protein 1C [Cytophagales bacterium]|nr:penicillin-binding protein 1C [Cytophagales bacterium]
MSNSQFGSYWLGILKNRIFRYFLLPLLVFFLAILIWPLNEPYYSYSTIINDSKGELQSASVAPDGQWRFPKPDSVPFRVRESIRYFEDKYFYKHPGINPGSIVRAIWQNIRDGRVVSGASTLTMQIARMMGGNQRTLTNKLQEMMVALKLEMRYSKKELMIIYASMAPFGGNVVGLEAASWRYYGRAPHLLSWGESAALAVLPNQPGAIFPGNQDSLLIKKRNRLLLKLQRKEVIDQLTYELAITEPVPGKPLRIPNKAGHLLATFTGSNEGERLNSTIDPFWQSRVSELVENHHLIMNANGVENLAALVVNLDDGRVLAYKGNTNDVNADGYQVDIIQRPRSPGSTLKPLLYSAALDRGLILRRSMLSDVPSFFGGFSPKNFNRGYSGAVNANQALSRSLNIPMVHLLKKYSFEQFHRDLEDWGITTLNEPAGHYGLSLILGGCEVTMWELSQVYFSMYKKMTSDPNTTIHFDEEGPGIPNFPMGEDAIWQTFQTMTNLARPEGERAWRSFNSSQLIAWKTGTSYGDRDAWAFGLNGNVLVAVWVGNADGEGRADLTGIKAAAPLMHAIMRLSDSDPNWLNDLKPHMPTRQVCKVSGMLANEHCPARSKEVSTNADKSGLCSFHKNYTMDITGSYRVNSDCYSLSEATNKTHFILPPTQGYYYRQIFPDYKGLPPAYQGCGEEVNPIGIIYPHRSTKIFIPKEITGEKGRVILQASHQSSSAILYWHVDESYLGLTRDDHQQEVWLAPGDHVLSLIDGEGNKVSRRFVVIGEE